MKFNHSTISFEISDIHSGVDYSNISLINKSGISVDYEIYNNTLFYSNKHDTLIASILDKVGNEVIATVTIK
ncbi:MAG: hypothetical protein ACK5L6_11015 [Anaerorhabdus sp.]